MIYPEFLHKGSTIGISAPSAGVGRKLEDFDRSLSLLKKKGWQIKETASVRLNDVRGGDAKTRGEELTSLFKDNEVDFVMAAAGGDFLNEMLEYVNWKIAVVETVVKERLTETGSDIFMLLYVGNKTYREAEEILQRKRKVKLTNRGIASMKEKIHAALCLELEFRSAIGKEWEHLNMLKKETADADPVNGSSNEGVMPYARAL